MSVLPASVASVNQNSSPALSPEMNGAGGMYGLDDHIYQRLLRERIVFLGSEVRDRYHADSASDLGHALRLGMRGARERMAAVAPDPSPFVVAAPPSVPSAAPGAARARASTRPGRRDVPRQRPSSHPRATTPPVNPHDQDTPGRLLEGDRGGRAGRPAVTSWHPRGGLTHA